MKLRRALFGNPVLRQVGRPLSLEQIGSAEIQELISSMHELLNNKKYGIGLAAPQVGYSLALTVIGVKPTPTRPDNPAVSIVAINPKITETFGSKTGMWEGCISLGSGSDFPYAKALRYKKVRVSYLDELGKHHDQTFEGILAHVFQHETDHLNGILFVDRVKDTTTYMSSSEYRKHRKVGIL